MTGLDEIHRRLSWKHVFRGQFQHLLLGLMLVSGVLCLVEPSLTGRRWGPLSHRQLVHVLVVVVVAHQAIVALVWRLQLCFGTFSRLFGRADLVVWGVLFSPFLGGRVVLFAAVGLTDYGSLGWPRPLEIGLGALLFLPALYTLWSVLRHFGLIRALGADHFRAKYRCMPLVREGIFRYSDNAMYTFGFTVLWGLALLFGSRTALILALFQHAYIWVHLYCTEAPDLAVLYGDG